jgi:hypothetical protein
MRPSPFRHWDVLEEFEHWDERTQRVVRNRLENVPPIRFFSESEARTLHAVADRLLPQPDRAPDQRVPIVPFIDEALARGETDGFREPDMPWEQQAWRAGLAALDETARRAHRRPFADLPEDEQDRLLTDLQAGRVDKSVWAELPAKKFFKQLLQQVVTVYYAHPKAWSEIGWAGPANLRGYMRTGLGRRDPWEPEERREASSVEIVRRHEPRQSVPGGTGGATH